ncbi:MAG: hypothetical protein JO314_02385 [Acidobacteria bacterium]|nr:hypothetical protein [Acidobacteriota bacterium]
MDDGRSPGRPSALETILLGGLAIGVLDMLDAFTFFGWYSGSGAQRVFQGVAAGLIGVDAARSGGWSTFWLGLGLHYVTAICVAAAYFLCTRIIPAMITHPIWSGLVFGAVAHFVMQCVVIPLSAIHRWPPTFPLLPTLNGVIGHALLVGLPVALIAAWPAKRHSLE